MTDVRESPSGPKVAVTGAVSSVFGRTGVVVADDGDYDSDQVDNLSTVPGVSVSDALDTLLAGSGGGTGAVAETFCGGQATSITASNAAANIGNLGWNYITFGTATGNSVNMLAGEVGAVGIRRIISPTALNAGANVYLGGAAAPMFDASDWSSLTWRARFDDVQGADERCQVGVMSAVNAVLGAGESAGVIGQLTGTGSSPNYQTVTSHLGAGNTRQSTGVPIDALFHNFEIVRVDADTIEFYVDGVLRTTHSTGNGDGMPTGSLVPIGGAIGGGSSTLIDLDDFRFEPVS